MSSTFQRQRWEGENETSGLHGRPEQASSSVIILTELNELPGILCNPWLGKATFSPIFVLTAFILQFLRLEFNTAGQKVNDYILTKIRDLFYMNFPLFWWVDQEHLWKEKWLPCWVQCYILLAFRKHPVRSPAISIAPGWLSMSMAMSRVSL